MGVKMTDKTFEEQFPSLKGKGRIMTQNCPPYSDDGESLWNPNDGGYEEEIEYLQKITAAYNRISPEKMDFSGKDIQQHCLDKQKVRDDINELINFIGENKYSDPSEKVIKRKLIDLKKELGL